MVIMIGGGVDVMLMYQAINESVIDLKGMWSRPVKQSKTEIGGIQSKKLTFSASNIYLASYDSVLGWKRLSSSFLFKPHQFPFSPAVDNPLLRFSITRLHHFSQFPRSLVFFPPAYLQVLLRPLLYHPGPEHVSTLLVITVGALENSGPKQLLHFSTDDEVIHQLELQGQW